MEVVDSVIFSQLIVQFKARLEKITKDIKRLRFSVKCWHRYWKRLWQLGNAVDIVMKIYGIVVVYQLMKDQQKMVYSKYCSGILTAKMLLTGKAVLSFGLLELYLRER